MAQASKLTPEEWSVARQTWECDQRDGYSWLVKELALSVSAPAVRKTAIKDGWVKKYESKVETKPEIHMNEGKPSKVVKVSQRNHGKVSEKPSETIRETLPETIETMGSFDEDLGNGLPIRSKPGRPSAYCDAYSEQAYKLCLLGATDAELADFFEVCERTINAWKENYPEFLQSIKRGKHTADAEVAESLYRRAIGCSHPDVHISNFQGEITVTSIMKHYPPDTGAAFIWLKNRQSKRWRDRIEIKEQPTIALVDKQAMEKIYQNALEHAANVRDQMVGRAERLGLTIDQALDDGE